MAFEGRRRSSSARAEQFDVGLLDSLSSRSRLSQEALHGTPEVHRRGSPQVVPRSEIPVSSDPTDVNLEVRSFVAHRVLGSMIPRSAVSLSWTLARHGQDVSRRSHPEPGLLIVLHGHAELVGGTPRKVAAGDVITIPKHHEYGFTEIGADGLHAIHVNFHGGDPVALGDDPPSFRSLVARNEARALAARSGPFFQLLTSSALRHEGSRNMFREALRVFSDAFQRMLFTRQAVCHDEAYGQAFEEHFREELGHNTLLKVQGDPRATMDPVLRATASWFPHQMLTLDNGGRAIVHLVLETAGEDFHALAKPVLSDDVSADYFAEHAMLDENHKEIALRLLEGQHPENYRRLEALLEETWDMFDAMTKRIAVLVELERSRT